MFAPKVLIELQPELLFKVLAQLEPEPPLQVLAQLEPEPPLQVLAQLEPGFRQTQAALTHRRLAVL